MINMVGICMGLNSFVLFRAKLLLFICDLLLQIDFKQFGSQTIFWKLKVAGN